MPQNREAQTALTELLVEVRNFRISRKRLSKRAEQILPDLTYQTSFSDSLIFRSGVWDMKVDQSGIIFDEKRHPDRRYGEVRIHEQSPEDVAVREEDYFETGGAEFFGLATMIAFIRELTEQLRIVQDPEQVQAYKKQHRAKQKELAEKKRRNHAFMQGEWWES